MLSQSLPLGYNDWRHYGKARTIIIVFCVLKLSSYFFFCKQSFSCIHFVFMVSERECIRLSRR